MVGDDGWSSCDTSPFAGRGIRRRAIDWSRVYNSCVLTDAQEPDILYALVAAIYNSPGAGIARWSVAVGGYGKIAFDMMELS
jgi:hypothetical protein